MDERIMDGKKQKTAYAEQNKRGPKIKSSTCSMYTMQKFLAVVLKERKRLIDKPL